MKATHTPGPWTAKQVSSGDCLLIIRANLANDIPSWELTEAMNERGENYIGRIELPKRDTYDERLETAEAANARLIAAAPELLAALKDALEVWDVCGPTSDRRRAWFDATRAAIAKTEGR